MADEEKKDEVKETAEEVKESSDEQPQDDVGVPTESVGKETKEEAPADAKATADKPAEEKVEEVKEEIKESLDEAREKNKPSVAEAKEDKPAPSGKFKNLIKEIETMTVSDLAELVKALEDRFGVSAAMPMAMAGAAGAPAAGAEEAEEKSSYTVMLKDSGAQKIAVIKAVREINQDLGLKEAKDLVDGAPKEIKKDVPKADAEEAKKKLEAAGATAELV